MTRWADIEPVRPTDRGRVGAVDARGTSGARSAAAGADLPRLRRGARPVLTAIDDGAHMIQRRGRDLLLGSAVVMLPMAGAGIVLSNVGWRQFQRIDGAFGDVAYVGAERMVWMIAIALQLVTTSVVGGFVAVYSIERQLGRPIRVRSALARTARKTPMLVGVWGATHWWVLIGFYVMSRVSFAGFVLIAVTFSPLVVAFSAIGLFAAPVVMTEPASGALRRTFAIGRHSFGAAYAFVVVNTIVVSGVLGCIALLPRLATATGLVTFGSWEWLAQGIASQVALLVSVPLSAAGTAQLYLQVRMAREGVDLWWEADRVFGVHR